MSMEREHDDVWAVMGHDDGRSWDEREADLDAHSEAEYVDIEAVEREVAYWEEWYAAQEADADDEIPRVYAVVYAENSDIVATYSKLHEALDDLEKFIDDHREHPELEHEIGVRLYENGRAAGQWESAAQVLGGKRS